MRDTACTGKKRKLLFVISTLYLGGAQKVASILANALAERYDVTVAYCFDSGKSHVFRESCGIRKLPDYDRDAGLLKKAGCVRKQIGALKALKKELGIDAAISLGNVPNLLNAMSKGKERVICSERSDPRRSWGRMRFLTRLSYRRADYVVFQSEAVRALFGERMRGKSCVLKNPVRLPAPARDRREKEIVAMGRLTAQKNYDLLIRGFARFHEQFPEYRLRIFGEGELEGRIKQLIGTLRMNGSVILEGHDPDVHERIRDAEMFVLSSDWEGLSNALLECMAMGIASISTRCGGSVDVIRDGENGLLVDIGDEEGLARAMCTLARDPELRRKLERQAKEDLKAYDMDVVVRDWERVIRQML